MAKAIRIHAPGGPDSMQWEEVTTPAPAAGEVRLRQTAIGLNYIDVYHRTGLYKMPEYPITLGLEGAAIVEEVGEGVTSLVAGDRVAYGGGPIGAYATERVMPAEWLVKIPDTLSDEQAAAAMVQGLTAEFLVKRTYPLISGKTCLIHAVSGGVGTLLCQWAKHLGAHVIGTTSTDEKAALAKANGCDEVILYTQEEVVPRLRELTNGAGVDVVYDSVGKDTFLSSLDCLKPLGMMVSYGQASGPIPPFDISLLVQKGSLFLTRPSMMHYFANPAVYQEAAADVLHLIADVTLNVHVGQTFKLEDAAAAHRALEARKTHGATVLLVK